MTSNLSRSGKQRLWEKRLAQWSTSGLSQAEYCRSNNIGLKSFQYWKRDSNSTAHHPPSSKCRCPNRWRSRLYQPALSFALWLTNAIALRLQKGSTRKTLSVSSAYWGEYDFPAIPYAGLSCAGEYGHAKGDKQPLDPCGRHPAPRSFFRPPFCIL